VARLDAPVNHAGLVVLEGNLYVVGGYSGPDNRPTDRLTVVNLATGTIRQAAPLPTPRGALAAAALDGRIHAVGGTTESSVRDHDVYDPTTDTWSRAAPLRVPRNHLAAVAHQGLIFAFGGRDETSFTLDAAETYDPKRDSWTAIAPLPTGRSGIGAAVFEDTRIVVFGGEVGGAAGRTFGEAEAYDPATNTWEALAPMPTPRHGLGVAAAGGDIFVIAGGPQPGLTATDQTEVLCGAK
jgi:N-acetylneuraminic acid mutarotase